MSNAVNVESVPLNLSHLAPTARFRTRPAAAGVSIRTLGEVLASMSVSSRKFGGVAELPDLRDSIRDERIPAACLLLRGGPDSVAKLHRHAERMRRVCLLDGDPVLGISMFAALDSAGTDSWGGILSGKLQTYRFVHTARAGVITATGFRIVPTFRRPHVTVLIGSANDIPALLAALGRPQVNDKYGEARRRRRPTDDHR